MRIFRLSIFVLGTFPVFSEAINPIEHLPSLFGERRKLSNEYPSSKSPRSSKSSSSLDRTCFSCKEQFGGDLPSGLDALNNKILPLVPYTFPEICYWQGPLAKQECFFTDPDADDTAAEIRRTLAEDDIVLQACQCFWILEEGCNVGYTDAREAIYSDHPFCNTADQENIKCKCYVPL
uniref:Uncharacterized protein n=1 Tax=Helicotheca tamesis TaxID=374047 RepID=A0A7S2H369_9STRA|mmetsp:Transcript_14893/g.20287  ORF Transcript_14893/g.20287 Transcript_14893/m.20287 type:complete len:178 (+) Transcript_14893:246-779(+)